MPIKVSTLRIAVVTATLVILPSFAAAQAPRFALWKAGELKQRDDALATHVGPDHSSRETLAEFKSQRFRLLFRDADGAPEVHDDEVDVVIVQSGEGVLLVGGKMVGARQGGRGGGGATIEGGERYPLAPGDVAHIPARIPHAFLVPKGKHITYILVKFPPPPE